MTLTITLILLALASSGVAYYFGFYAHGLGLKWYAFVTTAVGIPVGYFFWLIVIALILFIASLFNLPKLEERFHSFSRQQLYNYYASYKTMLTISYVVNKSDIILTNGVDFYTFWHCLQEFS